MKIRTVAVTVPIYKEKLNDTELVSLNQCLNVLGSHPIIFFAPVSLNTVLYEELFKDRFTIERFDDKYFTDLNAYNKLMLALKFYKRFKIFEYILIYQLDAYVFKDELQYWCNAGYDYIGAPWFNNWCIAQPDSAFLGIGNGGFSLRKVKSHLKVLNSFRYIKPFRSVVKKLAEEKFSLSLIKQVIVDLTIQNNTFSMFNNYGSNEDIFWGMVASAKFKDFNIPTMKEASQFSMEVNAEMLYHLNDNILPFGCHGWEKYETDFWHKFIFI